MMEMEKFVDGSHFLTMTKVLESLNVMMTVSFYERAVTTKTFSEPVATFSSVT